jgi:hypothetical protein
VGLPVKLSRKVRDFIALAVQDLDDAGIPWQIEFGKRHHKMLYEIDGKVWTLIVASSPSDKRAALNFRSQVRNSIRRRAA